MDRQEHRGMGALRASRLMTGRHHPPRRCRPCCGTMYQPEWLTEADRTMAVVCGRLSAAAGTAIGFTDGCDAGSTVRLHAPGIYYAQYALHMPAGQTAQTDLQLVLNGTPLPESLICCHADGALPAHAAAHAMFEVDCPADLQLITLADIELHAHTPHPLLTLAVFRIG